MVSSKRKTVGFRTEEKLADVVNEILNDSDSHKDKIPEFSSSEDSESESANRNDNESNISILALAADRQMLPQIHGFLKTVVNQEYHPHWQSGRATCS